MIFEILCAGKSNAFSLEDSVCAGRLISEIINRSDNIEVSDTARVAISLNESFGPDTLKMLKESEHGKLLSDNGFDEDLEYSARVDTSSVIPYLTTNVLKSLPGE